MSWSEIKKSVNSNLAVPLDKKIEHVGGIIPIGCLQKSVVHTSSDSSGEVTILEIEGEGYVSFVQLAVYASGAWTGAGSVLVYSDEILSANIGFSVYGYPTQTVARDITYDWTIPFSTGDPLDVNSSGLKTNVPLEFKKGLKVVHMPASKNPTSNVYTYSTATVIYAIKQ